MQVLFVIVSALVAIQAVTIDEQWANFKVGAMEGQFFLKHGKLVSLSEQQLVDCSTKDNGCHGGNPKNAFDYVKRTGGIDTEESYPYTEFYQGCRYDPNDSVGKVSGYVNIKSGSEEDLKNAIATVGPISVGIFANTTSFMLYKYGVYDNPTTCKSGIYDLDHAVLAIGYGTTNKGEDFYLVKNSWGTHWGEKGFIQMSRNKNNQCGIATDASYPTVS